MAATLPADSSPTAAKNMIKTSGSGQPRSARKPWADTLFALLARASALLTLALLIGIIVSLIDGAMPAIRGRSRTSSSAGPRQRPSASIRSARAAAGSAAGALGCCAMAACARHRASGVRVKSVAWRADGREDERKLASEERGDTALLPGHGEPATGAAPIRETRAWLVWLADAMRQAARDGLDMNEVLARPLPPEFARLPLAASEYRRSVGHLFPAAEQDVLEGRAR